MNEMNKAPVMINSPRNKEVVLPKDRLDELRVLRANRNDRGGFPKFEKDPKFYYRWIDSDPKRMAFVAKLGYVPVPEVEQYKGQILHKLPIETRELLDLLNAEAARDLETSVIGNNLNKRAGTNVTRNDTSID